MSCCNGDAERVELKKFMSVCNSIFGSFSTHCLKCIFNIWCTTLGRCIFAFLHFSVLCANQTWEPLIKSPPPSPFSCPSHRRYQGDCVCLCHHGGGCDPRRDPGLQHGRPPAVWMRGDQEPSPSEAALVLHYRRRSQVGVGGLRRRCGVRLRKVKTVHGRQEKTGKE